MKQPASYGPAWEAALGYAWRERLASLNVRVRLQADPGDVFAHLLPL